MKIQITELFPGDWVVEESCPYKGVILASFTNWPDAYRYFVNIQRHES